ncbi:unnamed protein product [Pleuronectes platessa]|uniref:Uncharacterized protein n=1 Tax=Pleuronectes platessa TaxID=8262 RepID=A0A9N7Z0B4_PLEPL|nr:unnamed protein product [Pleuronectes platessa]
MTVGGEAGEGEEIEEKRLDFEGGVGLCGPGGPPAEGPGQFYCPVAFQSMKDTEGDEGGVLSRWKAQIASPLLLLLLLPPCPVLSCPLRSRGAGKSTCLKSTPQGQTPISPISFANPLIRSLELHVHISVPVSSSSHTS